MNNKKLLCCVLILILCLSVSGCSSLFLREDARIVDHHETKASANVRNMELLGSGILQDVSADGEQLLVFSTSKAPPTTYNIELYQYHADEDEWTVINFVNSDKPNDSGVFSSDNTGVFYLETSSDNDRQKEMRQLVWTSIDHKTTLTLSDENENIVTNLCRMPDGKVLYANDNHQIRITNAGSWHQSYALDPNYDIETLSYDSVNRSVIFTGTYQDDPTVNLYIAAFDQDRIVPVLLDQDIVDYDLNPDTGNMVYIKRDAQENKLILYSGSNGQTKKITVAGINDAVLSNDEQFVFYTVPLSDSKSQYQSIEMITAESKNTLQVTSPRTIVSELFFRDDRLFFSACDETVSSSDEAGENYTYMIEIENE